MTASPTPGTAPPARRRVACSGLAREGWVTVTVEPSRPVTVPVIMFILGDPMKPATKVLAGVS